MAKEHSHVKKRRRGCLGGCLTRILLLLGLCAVLLVGACVLGVVKNDPQTGKPSLSLEGVGLDSVQLPDLGNMHLPDLGGLELPEGSMDGALEWAKNGLSAWPYAVSRSGLTIKTLRAGDGEAVLVCADGYTMLVGGGSGMGAALTAQLLLSGAGHLNAAVAMSADAAQIGGMPLAITLILLALIGNLFDHDRVVYVSVTAFTCFAALFDLMKTLPEGVRSSLHLDGAVGFAQKILPWFDLNLGWIVPAVVGFVVGMMVRKGRNF